LVPKFEGAAPIVRAIRRNAGTILAYGVISDQPVLRSEVPKLASPLSRPTGVIFDLDGTLVDTVSARIDGWLEALADADLSSSRERVAPMIGMDGKRLARQVADAAGRHLSEKEVETIDRAAGAAFDRLNRAPRTLPGAREVLAELDRLGIRWVIATSSRKEQVVASVAALGLERAPEIVDGGHVRYAKPAPDLLLLAAERLAARPARCWAVGDSTWDMLAAVAAGMTSVGVIAGSAVSEEDLTGAGASLVVRTLDELVGELER
jgi:HAD superfamily hydrolase (TIGR01509 family)